MLPFAKKYASITYSQNGEDGLIAECLRRLDIKRGICCEFGAADGKQFSNTALLIDQGWTGVMIEADTELYSKCRDAYRDNAHVIVSASIVSPANVNYLVPKETSVLSIDIEESCYKVWEALEHKPAIVIIEINSDLRPDVDHVSAQKGANYSAMVKLGLKKGYALICHVGNLIFINMEYLPDFKGTFPELFEISSPAGDAEIVFIDPLENIEKYFDTSWLPEGTPRPWENRAMRLLSAQSINAPITYPIINPDAPPNYPPPAPVPILSGEGLGEAKGEAGVRPRPPTIGILVTATGNFLDFIPALHTSLQNFCPGLHKTMYLFTDKPASNFPDTVIIPVIHKPFPLITLDRYARYMKFGQKYVHHDYLFHIDADMQVVQVGQEILKPLLAVQHPLFPRSPQELGSWEENMNSTAYTPKELQKIYVCGGIQGGEAGKYLQVCGLLAERVQEDYRNEIMAVWHDESHWNWYVSHYPEGVTILHPGYCYPQEKAIPFEKHIIALDKDKAFYR